ncbi:hypothetical protein [Gilvibacter sediminis]|uniref:hypothetical protein n=1 Tax=Gilvibacter sediminis TaxID=379071 RepID=UPI002350E763|nr:hypothetical protein [Gilvibacter sediminis]MDC7998048.1 hypothetical protein [Gilvibacter sediminis]
MKANQTIATILRWIPSLLLCLISVPNALDKMFNTDPAGKIVESPATMIVTGIFLLLATILFLLPNTVLYGTAMLVIYMSLITVIHLYKEKPHEVALLIVIATIFAAYLRFPVYFKKTE